MTVFPFRTVACFCLIFAAHIADAGNLDINPKTTGIGISIETQQQDYTLQDLRFNNVTHPLLTSLANAKDQIKASSDVQSVSLKMDRWVTPNINVFGSVAKISGEGIAKLPTLPGLTLPDVKIDADGVSYNAGVTAVARKDSYFAALTYTQKFYKPDSMNETNESYSIMPTIGKVTGSGIVTLGMLYQDGKGNYIGTTSMPPVGAITADISVESEHKISWLAGYRAELDKNLYLRTVAEFGGKQGVRLELGKRF
ncbi:hypothetical protein [Thiothrix subterranea]|uniref:Lipoprotein n=1 Tax=Thiothrix subterranea TaxID=2735563 RepID=A0ABU0Y288_9GAMM|nr:hypothetical protein [Thiothrix subterranea]MDQ5766904.1 hypothetical protein [Thiothrix subterranea]